MMHHYIKKIFVFFSVTFFSVFIIESIAIAYTDAPILTQLYAQAVEQYKTTIKQLDELKIQGENLDALKKQGQNLYKDYKFVKRFSLDHEINRVKSDLASLTYLDSFEGASNKDKFTLLQAEIDKRFKSAPKAGQKKTQLQKDLSDVVKQLESLETLKQTKLQESEVAASGNMPMENSLASIASSLDILVALEVEKKQLRMKKDMDAKLLLIDKELAKMKHFSGQKD